MIRSTLAVLGLAFILYWFSASDLPTEEAPVALDPVPPKSLTLLPSKVGQFKKVAQEASVDKIMAWLKHEARSVGQIDPDPKSTLRRLKDYAAKLRRPDIQTLRKAALDYSLDGDQRFMAVYILSLRDQNDSIDALREVVTTPMAATPNERAYSDDLAIRFHALESAAQKLNRDEATSFIRDLLKQTSDASLAKHASYLLGRLR